MRLLRYGSDGELSLTKHYIGADEIPPYAILSHTWQEGQEVTLDDLVHKTGKDKSGHDKIVFCAQQAKRDGLHYFWVDTCSIDKSSSAELSEAINSMFKWYEAADRCYVYLSDVSAEGSALVDGSFQSSRWFTRGWTLQELLAPSTVQFFTRNGVLLGDKSSLGVDIAKITGIPLEALQGKALAKFSIEERISWAKHRKTRLGEDKAYSLLGILDVKMLMMYSEGEEGAFKRLYRAIREAQAESTAIETGNVHWMVFQSTNSLFTGRSELLAQIQNAFHLDENLNRTEQKRFVITGIGGQGKSEVCVKVASLMREDFWGVFWVDVSNQSTAQDGFVAIAKLLGSSAETIRDSLQALASITRRWLLILDNADDPCFDYTIYFPSGNRGSVIMTSRILECQYYSTVGHEALGGLDLQNSTQLLLKAARIQEELWSSHTSEAQDIVRLLGSHTLALIQAGAFIAAGYCCLGQYSERYRQQRKKLLEHHPNQEKSRYQDVYATFEASAEVLKHSQDKSGKDAMDLLAVLSMLHSSHLPIQVFQDAGVGARLLLQAIAHHEPRRHRRFSRRFGLTWKMAKARVSPGPNHVGQQDAMTKDHVFRLPEFLHPQDDVWDDHRLLKASALLVSLSLVTRHQSDQFDVLSMHPLAHAWAKDRLEKKHQEEVWISTACIFVLSRRMSDVWERYEGLLRPHMQLFLPPNPQILLSFESQQVMLPLLIHCGYILLCMGEHHRTRSLLDGIYQELGLTPWTPSNAHLPIWTLASRNQLSLHNTKLAIVLLEHVTEAEKTLLAESHPERLISLYNLALAYNDNGQSFKAVSLLTNVIELFQTKHSGEMYSGWLASAQYQLARAYNAIGSSEKGVALLEHVVKTQEAPQSGVPPLRLLASQHALATAYNTNKQTKEALALLEHVTKAYETMLEETHPDWQGTQYELARAYLRDEQVEKALSMLKRVVVIQKTILEKTSFALLSSQYMLSAAYTANQQPKEGRDLLEYVVQMYGTILHDIHPVRVQAEYTLAVSYIENEQNEKALVLLRRVVEVRKATLEITNPLRQQSEETLAELQAEAG